MFKIFIKLCFVACFFIFTSVKAGSFTVNNNGTVTDSSTGLTWQQQDDGVVRNWSNSVTYCDNLVLGGYTDWRLPSIYELGTLLDYSRAKPYIDTTTFLNVQQGSYWITRYWTETSDAGYPNNAWHISFDAGSVGSHLKTDASWDYSRCVRGTVFKPLLTVLDNNIVTDSSINLMWQRQDDNVKRSLDDAKNYCQNLTLSGYSGWRLPTGNEIQRIVDYSKFNPATNTSLFPTNNTNKEYWTNIGGFNFGLIASLYNGTVQNYFNTTATSTNPYTNYARCVHSVVTQPTVTNCNIVTEIPVSECQSLLELYNSTNGANWTNKTGWNQTNTPCSWYGVTCSSGRVTEIRLEQNKLTGTLSNLNLPNLQILYLKANQLSGSIPNFSNLPKLIGLYLNANKFSGTIPNLSNLPNLQELYLSENQLSGSIPDFSNLLPNLRLLFLSFNQLSGSIPNFSNLVSLGIIQLSSNQLSGSIPNLSNLPNLLKIDLGSNQLSGSIPNFSNLPNLNYLYLTVNQLSGNIPNFSLPNLKELFLGGNQLSGNIPNFSNLPKLENLYLWSNQLSGNIPDFSNLPNLKILVLSLNQLSGNVPSFTSFNLANLQYAKFDNNCGLTAYDSNQETILNQKDPNWKTKNPNCLVSTNYTVTLNKSGTGSGTTNGGGTFAANTTLNLAATPDANSIFAGWSPSPCNSLFQMPSNNLTCTATFTLKQFNLTVSKTGNGTISATGINCGTDCNENYNANTSVSLTATPDTNYSFLNWGGDCSGTNPVLSLTINAAKNCTANFSQNTYVLTLNKTGTGSGTISGGGTFAANTTVNLITTPDANSTFTGWAPSPCNSSFQMPANNLTCTATFLPTTFNCNNVTEITVSECQSLLELYNSTNGANWTNNTGWNQTNTPCSWYGVTCSGGYVQRISLNENQLSGILPNLNFPSLTGLYLGLNQLSGSIPNFSSLPNLQQFYLEGNQLSGSIPNFTNLPNLKYLWLNFNQLSGSIPNFTNLPNLQELYLASNQLSGSIPNFTNLPNLKYLYLYSNQLSGNILNFTNLPNLQELYLASNQLSGSIPNFTNLSNLQYLSLYSNQLSGSIPNFTSLPNLQQLYLSYNQLSGSIPNFTSFSLSSIAYADFNNNCGLTAYDSNQEAILNQKDPNWKTKNLNCPVSANYTITLNKMGTGSGTISGDGSFAANAAINLIATPDANSTFTGWSPSPCNSSFQMPANNLTCTANFALKQFNLTVNKTGNGTISATGINCGADCNETYNANTPVSLTATPDTGYIFNEWNGGCLGNSANCTLTIDANKNVTANFSLCTYSLVTTSANHSDKAENGLVNITTPTNCNILAQSNASWITITSQSSGVVNYSILANTTTQSRTGTLTIDGQTFTINQSGNVPPQNTQQPILVLGDDLQLTIPHLTYFSPNGLIELWAKLVFSPVDNRLTWEVVEYGTYTGNEPSSAILSSDFHLIIPNLSYQGGLWSIEMHYAKELTGIKFELDHYASLVTILPILTLQPEQVIYNEQYQMQIKSGKEGATLTVLQGTNENKTQFYRVDIVEGDASISLPDANLGGLMSSATTFSNARRTMRSSVVYPINNLWTETKKIFAMYTPNSFNASSIILYTSFNRLPESYQSSHPYLTTKYFNVWSQSQTASELWSDCDKGDISCLQGKTPILFIHGYSVGGMLGGGEGTWGNFPKLLKDNGYVIFEFRWKTNARFEDVANELAAVVSLISQTTQKKVHILAHSFGGILTRTWLQDLASRTMPSGYKDAIASVVTFGTPHSGIFDENTCVSNTSFPKGQNSNMFEACGQVSCDEGGEPVYLPRDVFELKETGWLVKQLATTTDLLPKIPFFAQMGVIGNLYGDPTKVGDSLISLAGQRFYPNYTTSENCPILTKPDTLLSPVPLKNNEIISVKGTTLKEELLPNYYHTSSYINEVNAEVNVTCDTSNSCTHKGFNNTLLWLKEHEDNTVITFPNFTVDITVVSADNLSNNPLKDVAIYVYDGIISPIFVGYTDSNGKLTLQYPFVSQSFLQIIATKEPYKIGTTSFTTGTAIFASPISLTIGLISSYKVTQGWITLKFPQNNNIATGFSHSCGLTINGSTKCWGGNIDGQLGDGTIIDKISAVNVSGLNNDVISIVAGNRFTCALLSMGNVKCWGANNVAQLGNGTLVSSSTPKDVLNLPKAIAITAGDLHACALSETGSVKCWGSNANGRLGIGTTGGFLHYPINDVIGLTFGSGIISISAGSSHTCALTTNGSVKCWGSNSAGQLGNNTTADSPVPVDVVGLNSDVISISAGLGHSCALLRNGTVKCWGDNSYGQLGLPVNTTKSLIPVRVDNLTDVTTINTGGRSTHTCVVVSSGGVKCWGNNGSGQLGNGTNSNSNVPVDVLNLNSPVLAIDVGGNQTCVLTSDNKVKCWGSNQVGQITNIPVDIPNF